MGVSCCQNCKDALKNETTIELREEEDKIEPLKHGKKVSFSNGNIKNFEKKKTFTETFLGLFENTEKERKSSLKHKSHKQKEKKININIINNNILVDSKNKNINLDINNSNPLSNNITNLKRTQSEKANHHIKYLFQKNELLDDKEINKKKEIKKKDIDSIKNEEKEDTTPGNKDNNMKNSSANQNQEGINEEVERPNNNDDIVKLEEANTIKNISNNLNNENDMKRIDGDIDMENKDKITDVNNNIDDVNYKKINNVNNENNNVEKVGKSNNIENNNIPIDELMNEDNEGENNTNYEIIEDEKSNN